MFNDLLNEAKGSKYKTTLKVVLKNTKHMEKLNWLHQFNLTTKTVINHKFHLEKVFELLKKLLEILNRTDN